MTSRVGALLARAVAFARRPTLLYLLASALGKVGALLLLPLYSRRLSPAEYGTYALAQSVVSVAPALLSLGGSSAINKFYFAEKDRALGLRAAGSVARFVAVLTVATTLLVGLVALAFSAQITRVFSQRQVGWLLLAGLGSATYAMPSIILRADGRVRTAAVFQFAELFVTSATGLLLVGVLNRGLDGSIEALGGAYALGEIATVVFLVSYARGPWDLQLARTAFVFSIGFIPHFAALWLQGVADRWTLKLVGDDALLGPYSVASQLTAPSAMVVNAWNMERATRDGELVRSDGVAKLFAEIPRIRIGYLASAILPAVGTVLALPFLRLLVGTSFSEAFVYLPFLLASVVIDSLYYSYNHVVYYGGHPRTIGLATTTAALLAVAANVVLIPLFGVRGAVAARLTGSIARVLAMSVAARFSLANKPAKGGVVPT